MKSLIQMISFFITLALGSSQVVIGNYKELNPSNCGISEFISPGNITDCFKWHKNIDPEQNGSPSEKLDVAPWIVHIITRPFLMPSHSGSRQETKCRGTLIANNWVLTVALCIHSAGDILLFAGNDLDINNLDYSKSWPVNWTDVYIERNEGGHTWYDLALINVEGMYNMKSGQQDNICLPEKRPEGLWDDTYPPEYVMTKSWTHQLSFLKMEYWRIPYVSVGSFNNSGVELTVPLSRTDCSNRSSCMGHMGNPMWQYHFGRAVLVAVLVKTIDQRYLAQSAIGVRVDTKMDWIQKVTRLD